VPGVLDDAACQPSIATTHGFSCDHHMSRKGQDACRMLSG